MGMDHDGVIRELQALARKVDGKTIAGAFVASLGREPGFWRAPLIALAAARAVPKHAIGRTFTGGQCKECGLEKKVEEDEVHERGQCLPGDLAGALAVLRLVASPPEPAPKPTKEDGARLTRLFTMIGELPATAREGQLAKEMAAEEICAGNKYDRRHVIETLGACGILETNEHPGFTTRWTTFAKRQDRPSVRVECDPPIAFWTAAHGVNAANVATWFGHLGIRAPKASAARVAEREVARVKTAASADRKAKRAARTTEYVVGDAVAFAFGAKWVAAIVIELTKDAGGTHPVIELVQWKGKASPTREDLVGAEAAKMKWGKSIRRSPMFVGDLWKRDDPRGRWKYIASGLPMPRSKLELGNWSVQRVENIESYARDASLL